MVVLLIVWVVIGIGIIWMIAVVVGMAIILMRSLASADAPSLFGILLSGLVINVV